MPPKALRAPKVGPERVRCLYGRIQGENASREGGGCQIRSKTRVSKKPQNVGEGGEPRAIPSFRMLFDVGPERLHQPPRGRPRLAVADGAPVDLGDGDHFGGRAG